METVIDLSGLNDEEIEVIEKLVSLLRGRDKRKVEGGFNRSAGSWKGLVDAERLKREIYADRRQR